MPRALQMQVPKGSELVSTASFRSRLLAILVVTQTVHRPWSSRATGVLLPLPFTALIPAPYSEGTEQAPVAILGVAKGAPPDLAVTHTHPKGRHCSSNGAEASIPIASCPSAVSLSWSGEHWRGLCAPTTTQSILRCPVYIRNAAVLGETEIHWHR